MKNKPLLRPLFLAALVAAGTGSAAASGIHTPASRMEKLDRGLVALPSPDGGMFVSWRLLGTDSDDTMFRLLRDGEVVADSMAGPTCYVDSEGRRSSRYSVVTLQGGEEREVSAEVTPWAGSYKTLRLDRPKGGADYGYIPGESSVADVDGDGTLEIVVKWTPSNQKDNSQEGYTGSTILDCYRLDGTKLWRVDLGINIRSGFHYTQFLFYDLSGDGRAELVCKTAPGSVDGEGRYVTEAADDEAIRATDNTADHRNSEGRVLAGGEFLTVFDGLTGRALHTVWYNPNRGFVTGRVSGYGPWGDDYGNRGDRFLACVAYLDGPDSRPSAVMCRGYYTQSFLWAVDFDGSRLSTKWLHASMSPTRVEVTDAEGRKTVSTYSSNTSGIGNVYTAYGQGAHSLSVGDVDGDGSDEIMYGGAAIDNDGSLLYSTGLGHGDAQHLGDFDPDRPGLEYIMSHESAPFGFSYRDAATGELLLHVEGSDDTERCMAADIYKDSRGHELWASDPRRMYDVRGNVLGNERPAYEFRLYWDGDAFDELMDENAVMYDGSGQNIFTPADYGRLNTYGDRPVLGCDLFGDWREEFILWNSEDSTSLNIFTTTTPANFRLPTLLHDQTYRMAIAWQNVGYNKPPHLGCNLADSMATRFVPVAGSGAMEQAVAAGQAMQPVVCRMVRCAGAVCAGVVIDGAQAASPSLPEGFSFTVDAKAGTWTLGGTPAVAGEYEFIVSSEGGVSGVELCDTVRLSVSGGTDGIEAVGAEGTSEVTYYGLDGVRIGSPGSAPRGVYVEVRRTDSGVTTRKVVRK